MSGPWKPTIFQGQNLANQIEENNRERATETASSSSTPNSEIRYQPIAPYGGTSVPNTNEKRRIGRACDECRRKKIKCYSTEGSTSCKNCISYQKGCTYNTGVKKRGPPRGYINILENRLKRIEGLIDTMSNESDQQKNANNTSVSPTADLHPSDDYNSCEEDIADEKQKDKPYEEEPPNPFKRLLNETSVMIDAIKSSNLTPEGRFVDGNSFGYLFSRKIKLIHESELAKHGFEIQHDDNSDYFHIKKLGSMDDRRRDQIRQLIDLGVIRKSETIKSVDDWIWRVAGIDKALSDRLLKVYFAYIHPLLPVINKIEFLQEYREISSSFPSGPLLNAVYGASVRYIENCKRFGDSAALDDGGPWEFPDNLAPMLFQNLIIFVKGKYAPCLSTIQAIVIAHNHSANVESWTSGWLLNCIAVRMSQDIGLHRSSDGWNISQQEKETRRMVWWQVYLLDRWFSAGTGRPLTAFDEDCDELYPTENVSLDVIMDTMTEQDQHLPRFPSLDEKVAAKATDSVIPMNQPFIHLLRLSEILGRILTGLYTPKAKKHSLQHGSDAVVGYLDDALSKWRASLPPLLEISSAGKRSSVTEDYVPLLSMSGLICLSYCTLLILLHRPFIENEEAAAAAELAGGNTTKDKSNSNSNKQKLSSQSALTICTSAAIRIVEVSESMHYRDFLMVSWGFALYPVFTAALIHIYNATNADTIVSDVAKSNLVRALHVVDKLCLLSPMATDMSNILKKIVALSSIFVDDPDFVPAVNIKKKSDDLPLSNQNSSTTETNEELHAEKETVNNSDNNLTLAFDATSKTPANNNTTTDNGNRKLGYKRQRGREWIEGGEWTPADEETLRNQFLPSSSNEHINKKRPLDISTPSWENGNWLNQLYTSTQPNFDMKETDSIPKNSNNNNSPSLVASPPDDSLKNYTAQQLYQRQFAQQSSAVDFYSIRQFGLNMLFANNEFPTDTLANVNPFDSNNQQAQRPQHNSSNVSPLSHQKQQEVSSSHSYQQDNVVSSLSVTQQQQQQQQQNNTSNNATTNNFAPLNSPSSLFEFSDFSYPFFYSTPVNGPSMPGGPANNGFAYNSNTSNNQALNNNTTASNNSSNTTNNATFEDPSALFRYRPDNPFWGIPSSMEVDDWHAYLLPHQQQQEQQQKSGQ